MDTTELDQLLKQHWQASEPAIAVDVGKARQWQHSQQRRLWAELSGSVLSVAIGLLFWWQGTSTLTDIAGAVMFVSGVGSGILARRARQPLLDWQNWTPEGILDYRLKETETTLKLVRSAVYAALLLLLFTLYLWWASRMTPETVSSGFALLYSACSVPAILFTLGWAGVQRRRTLRRQQGIRAALQSFQEMP